MSKNSKVMQMAAMAMALGGLSGMGDLLGGTHEPKAPKDPNDSRVAKAEAKRQRKAEKRRRDHEAGNRGNP